MYFHTSCCVLITSLCHWCFNKKLRLLRHVGSSNLYSKLFGEGLFEWTVCGPARPHAMRRKRSSALPGKVQTFAHPFWSRRFSRVFILRGSASKSVLSFVVAHCAKWKKIGSKKQSLLAGRETLVAQQIFANVKKSLFNCQKMFRIGEK